MPLGRTRIAGVVAGVAALAVASVLAGGSAEAVSEGDGGALTVRGTQLVDQHGREVVLRGFNVSGTAKLSEHDGRPFASVADAHRSATLMRQLTGANAVRFLLTWAAVEPAPGQFDDGYLRDVTAQLEPFLDQGFRVLLDFHQDLYSRHLFHAGSWYTGDGAPDWVVAAGHYPREFCGICVQWGQNITQNAAVQNATYDFWHNRTLSTPDGAIGVQDAFLRQAGYALRYMRTHLNASRFARVVGVEPFNEPYAGRYDTGQDGLSWERDLLLPFYRKFLDRMDTAGWSDKPAFIEPGMYWNANLDFVKQPGGFPGLGPLGPRFVFTAHFYDQKAISGIFMWGKAGDGQYSGDFAALRDRAASLGTAGLVSEFGSPISGYTSDKSPTVLKAMYQALDSRLPGAYWWSRPATSGAVLSGTQWQWDIYSDRHHELMNGNPDSVKTAGDAWNGEDFSVFRDTDQLRLDPRLLNRVYPAAVDGRTLAFTYEDRSDGLTWNPVPATLPAVRALVGDRRYAVLVWRSGAGGAPTEVRVPFSPVVVASPGTGVAVRDGTLRLSTSDQPGALDWALVAEGTAPPADQRTAASAELARWAATSFTP
jgi:hypothetical protein